MRTASNLPEDLIGIQLMRKAFHPQNGPLADGARVEAEREAAMHLFSGAIGTFKNPSSHRNVSYSTQETADLIRLANYLIRWVDNISQATP